MKNKIVIGITDCGMKFSNYENWIRNLNGNVEVVKLSYELNNRNEAKRCDGIILSGGHDVHPRFYNRSEFYETLDPNDIDERRDDFELSVIDLSQREQKPLLGICRGLQIGNVYFGGTLVPDILTHLNVNGHNKDEDSDSLHMIRVKDNTMLREMVNVDQGEVNSAHHQSADKIGEVLRVNSFSPEGIIEGLERKEGNGKSFLCLVQWHPERLKDQQNVFAGKIGMRFLGQAAQ